jgi:hypothetical protein
MVPFACRDQGSSIMGQPGRRGWVTLPDSTEQYTARLRYRGTNIRALQPPGGRFASLGRWHVLVSRWIIGRAASHAGEW